VGIVVLYVCVIVYGHILYVFMFSDSESQWSEYLLWCMFICVCV